MLESSVPIPVHFPLRGEWVAYNTPAHRVPSHGTDAYGQRYAYDFLGIDKVHTGLNTCRSSPLRYYLAGLPLRDFYAWGQPVYAPFDGTIVVAKDGWPERSPVQYLGVRTTPIWEGLASMIASRPWDSWIAGNHLIIKKRHEPIYAFLAHLKEGSITVSDTQPVAAGQHLAEVGHSGHSSEPHLHFHLMDRPDLRSARGLPCCFLSYEELNDDTWVPVHNGLPGRTLPIRSAKDPE